MATLYVKHNGSWRTVNNGDSLTIRHNGSWRTPREVYVKHNGSWEKVWVEWAGSLDDLPLGVNDNQFSGGAQAGIRMNSNGNIETFTSDSGNVVVGQWAVNGANGSNTQISIQQVSGDAAAGTFSGWQQLTSSKPVYLANSSGSKTCTIRIRIRLNNDGTTTVTKNVNLTATAGSIGPGL